MADEIKGPAEEQPPDDTAASGQRRPAPPAEGTEPTALLGELAVMRRRTRRERHAYWFPLVLFGVLTCAAVPFYLSSGVIVRSYPGMASYTVMLPQRSGGAGPILGGDPFSGSFFLGYYWLIALVGGYLLTALWYRWHARLAGLQTPARGYVTTGIILTAAALLLPPLSQFPALRWLAAAWPRGLVDRGTSAFLIIAAGLWVLAWVERSWGLAVTALLYSAAALLASLYDVENLLFRLGWSPGSNSPNLTLLPNLLLPAAVLLIGGAAAAGASLAAGLAARRERAAS